METIDFEQDDNDNKQVDQSNRQLELTQDRE
jgi:hypothetical protein